MDSAGLRWYRTGAVNITQGSTNITGIGTNWRTAGIQPGDVFMVGNSVLYEIAQVADNTNIVLNSAFQGATGTGQNYSIIRNFAGTIQAQIAAQVSELVNKYESYIDTELQQIIGPAGPTSFPYRGTWATGRTYDALDVVEYNSLLYMAVSGHTSTSENAPGAAATEWMPLHVAAYDDSEIKADIAKALILDGFTGPRAGRLAPLGERGFQIYEYDTDDPVGKMAFIHFDVDNKRLQLGHKDPGGGYIADGYFYPDEDTGWIALGVGEIKYRKKDSVVYIRVRYALDHEISQTGDVLFTMPEGFRPFPLAASDIDSFIPVLLSVDAGRNAILYCQLTGDGRCVTFPHGGAIPQWTGLYGMISYPV